MKKIFLFCWKIYKGSAFCVGTLLIILIVTGALMEIVWPKDRVATYHLKNGLVFTHDMRDGRMATHHIINENQETLVYSDVIEFSEYENTVYGRRRDLNENRVFFICTKNEPCLETQHLNDAQFRHLMEEKKLPSFGSQEIVRRNDLLKNGSAR